jgi:DNA primase catalytic core
VNLQEIKDTIKDRVDLAAIIGRHTKLIKEGRGFKANCPLPGHKEKTPSFHINTQKNFFYCYGCSRGGDVFTFLQMVEGLPFMDALKELAAQLNIELPKMSHSQGELGKDGQPSERDTGFELIERAAKFFHRVLLDAPTPGSKEALAYLKKRGISEQEIEELRLGYAPEAGDALLRKISNEDMPLAIKVGLVQQFERGRRVDFFRSRMMIPITDVRSRTIGFSGRVLDPLAKTTKYKNSSESEWFKKKTVVYGLDRASKFIRNDGYVCIVEGFFDQWAFHRCEIPAVAVMGTALTPEHLALIGRYTKQVILAMDADAAGVAATKKSLPVLMEAEWDVRVFAGFQGKDPDEWLADQKTQINDVKSKLQASSEGLEWLAKQTLREAQDLKLNRMQTFERLKDVWRLARKQAHKNLLADELAPLMGLSREEVKDSLEDLVRHSAAQGAPRGRTPIEANHERISGAENFANSARVGGAVTAKSTANQNPRDRAAEEAFVWWMWNWSALAPKSESEWHQRLDLFAETPAEALVTWASEEWLGTGELVNLEKVSSWLNREGLDDHLRRWILKGLVPPESGLLEDDIKILNSFVEFSNHLFKEKVRSEIAKLQNQLRALKGDELGTAQILQRVQALRLSLERRK